MAIKKLYRPFQSELFAKRAYRELRLLKHMRHENVSPKPAPDADFVRWPPLILPSPANPAHRFCFQEPGTSYLVSSQLGEAIDSFQEESGGRAQTPVWVMLQVQPPLQLLGFTFGPPLPSQPRQWSGYGLGRRVSRVLLHTLSPIRLVGGGFSWKGHFLTIP